MNQLAKLYQTKCIQLQEQIENLERLLEAAQTSPLSDAQWAETLKAAQEKQAEEVKQEEEKKKAEEAAKPKQPTPDSFFARTAEKYPSASKWLWRGAATALGLQALPRFGAEKMQPGTPASVTTTTVLNSKGKPVTKSTVVPSKPSTPGGLVSRFPIGLRGIPNPFMGAMHGFAERLDVSGQNKALAKTDTAAAAEVAAREEIPGLKKDVRAATAAKNAIPNLPGFAPQLAQASDDLKVAQQALSAGEKTVEAATKETNLSRLTASNRIKNPGLASRVVRGGGGAIAGLVTLKPELVPAGLSAVIGDLDTAKHLLGAAPAVLPAQGMVGSEVAAKAKDLAAKTAAKAASAGGKALSVLSPVETIASEVAGIGARALGLGAEVAGAAALAPLAIGAITRSAGGTEMRGSIEGMPFPPGVNSMEEYDEYLEKQRKQQNASAVQSLVGRGYNPEGRSATQRQ
jgi:hypothetical protein